MADLLMTGDQSDIPATAEFQMTDDRRVGHVSTVILDLLSGDPQLGIYTADGVTCLGITETSIVVVSGDHVSTWDLATRTAHPNLQSFRLSPHVSVSPDLSRIATVRQAFGSWSVNLEIYDVCTGRCLASAALDTGVSKSLPTPDGIQRSLTPDEAGGTEPRFTPDGREIWCRSYRQTPSADRWDRWEIVEDGGPGTAILRPTGMTACPPWVPRWQSPRGYRVTDDGWILSPAQQRLLWLPHCWRSDEKQRTWCGRFLGLLHSELPEVVILEFLD